MLEHVQNPKGPKIEKIQSRLKFSISIDFFQSRLKFFNPRPSEFPTKNRGWAGGSIENFNLACRQGPKGFPQKGCP